MTHPILGLHHVTATVDDAQADLDFCLDLLGLRLVKKTVNFDNHHVYHFYYGTERGAPGTIWTTFPYKGRGVRVGAKGAGQVVTTSFSVPAASLGFWRGRLQGHGVDARDVETPFGESALRFADPSGLWFELVANDRDLRTPWTGHGIGADEAIRGLHSVTMTVRSIGRSVELLTGLLGYQVVNEADHSTRVVAGGDAPGHAINIVVDPAADAAINGLGTVHHVAMAISTGDEQRRLRDELLRLGLTVTDIRDRCYFESIYFREPGGVLFEAATIQPGFTVDEDLASLGRGLKLPPWEEPNRPSIEANLAAIGTVEVDPHAGQPVVEAGVPLGHARAVVIMVHGRNAAPANVLDLVPRLARSNLTYLAPAAAGRTWYPHSFMAEIPSNEPGLSSGLGALESLVARVEAAGVPRSRIVLLGFSQGACLTAEFAARHASRFGGVVIFSGGVVGPPGTPRDYRGRFDGTPAFFGCSDTDGHVPEARVNESADLFTRMGAVVTKRIFPAMGHLVNDDEIAFAQGMVDVAAGPRVVFGVGAAGTLAAELDALGLGRPLIITTPGRASALASVRASLGARVVGVCDRATLHVPIDRVLEVVGVVDRLAPDSLLAVGGGSAIGLAKAVARERPLPIVAVPTTYAGSEMTNIWGVTDGDAKRIGRDAGVAPRLVVYDPTLTLSLPADVSAASGMNAIAHAVEAMYAAVASPMATAAAEGALRSLARALPAIVARPGDLDARTLALRGAHAAGVALDFAAMGLHHKICHVLGGTFDLPHAPTHAAVLSHVVAFNAPAAPQAMARIAAALGADDAAAGLAELGRALGLTMSLRSLGFRAADVDRAAELVISSAYANPRPVTVEDVRALLRSAL